MDDQLVGHRPPKTVQVFLEVYPQNASYRTDEARYGHVTRHGVKLPTSGPVDLLLPLVLCGEGGTVGSISGTAVKDGAPHPVRRVVAWSLDPYDPVSRPLVGWNIGTARADGTFVVADTRLRVRVAGQDGESVVLGVQHLVRMSAVRTGRRAYRFSGTVFPKRAGVCVDVLARTSSGLRLLATARTTGDGRWSVDRHFTGTATWDLVARTAGDGTNRSGTSPAVRVAIR